jgi:hypothetical protein
VAQTTSEEALRLGFLTIVQETNGYLGGYLVTNSWGRPLEFRLSSPVRPNRLQQILYGGTLRSYVCADLIGKTLVDRSSLAAQCLFTDCESVLDVRLWLAMPVVWLAPANDPIAEDLAEEGACVRPASERGGQIVCHPRYPADIRVVRELLDRLDSGLDLSEPFIRIRQAVDEARKMGMANRS